jgi:hypothetical protein
VSTGNAVRHRAIPGYAWTEMTKDEASAVKIWQDDSLKKAMRERFNKVQFGVTYGPEGVTEYPSKYVVLIMIDNIDHDYSSVLLRRREGGYFCVGATSSLKTAQEAVDEIEDQLTRELKEPAPEEEVNDTDLFLEASRSSNSCGIRPILDDGSCMDCDKSVREQIEFLDMFLETKYEELDTCARARFRAIMELLQMMSSRLDAEAKEEEEPK